MQSILDALTHDAPLEGRSVRGVLRGLLDVNVQTRNEMLALLQQLAARYYSYTNESFDPDGPPRFRPGDGTAYLIQRLCKETHDTLVEAGFNPADYGVPGDFA